jgi:origin recognition complex subunit 4
MQTNNRDIHEIMARAIDGESNSLLLLGGPGSGKSAIVTEALANLKAEHPDPGKFYTIRLDGQVQLDDKIALREIARQLALEMNIEMEKVRSPFV